MSFREAAAAEIRAHLARRKMSGRELARRLGEPHTWSSRRLSGEVPIDTNDLERIAVVLGMDVMTMLRDVPRWTSGSSLDGKMTLL